MTCDEIRDEAKSYSVLNDASIVVDSEVLNVIRNALAELVAAAPEMFAVRAQVAAPGAGQPYDLESLDTTAVWRVETTGGAKVHVVPLDQQDAAFDPRLYRVGFEFYAPGSSPDPSSDALVFYYSGEPTLPTDITDTVWSSFRDRWRRLLTLEVAKFFALKRSAADEAGIIQNDLDRALARFETEAERWRAMFDEPIYPQAQ